jgi:hypothetical protein
MPTLMRRAAASAALCLCVLAPARSALCDEAFFGNAALSAKALDEVRGGYLDESGLKISIGIERSVLINHELVDTTILRIPDLAAVTGRGGAVELQGSAASLIQNGARNSIEPAVLQDFGAGLLTVVQNSLDNQVIQGRTIMNVTISGAGSLGLSRTLSSLNFQLHSAR